MLIKTNIYPNHLKMVNQVLLQEDEAREVMMNLTEKEVVAFLMINDYQKMFDRL